MKNKKLISSVRNTNPEQFPGFEKLILEFSTGFANALIVEIDGKIVQALKQIVEYLDIDRCAFWEISEDEVHMRWIHQYVVPGLQKLHSDINYKDFPWVFKRVV